MPAHIFSLVFNTFLIPESSFAYIRRTTSGFLISCKWLPASGASLDLQPPPLCELSEVQGYLHLCLWWGELALGDIMQNKKNPCCSLLWNFMSTFILWLTKNPLHLHFIPQSQHDGALPFSKEHLWRDAHIPSNVPASWPTPQGYQREKHPAGVEHLYYACWDSLIRPRRQTMVATSSQGKQRTTHFGPAL